MIVGIIIALIAFCILWWYGSKDDFADTYEKMSEEEKGRLDDYL